MAYESLFIVCSLFCFTLIQNEPKSCLYSTEKDTPLKCNLGKKQYRCQTLGLSVDTQKRFDRKCFQPNKEFSIVLHSRNFFGFLFIFVAIDSTVRVHYIVTFKPMIEKYLFRQLLIKCYRNVIYKYITIYYLSFFFFV